MESKQGSDQGSVRGQQVAIRQRVKMRFCGEGVWRREEVTIPIPPGGQALSRQCDFPRGVNGARAFVRQSLGMQKDGKKKMRKT